MKTCTCPVGTAITSITEDACPQDIGQIQKVIFQRKYSTGTTRNTFADLTTIKAKANWTPLMTAVDGTKAQIVGYIADPKTTPGAVKEYGSDNQVPNGIPIVVGREHTKFEAEILSLSPVTASDLKNLECEDLQVYLVNEAGQIIAVKDGTEYRGIDISGFFTSDRNLGGFAEPDKVMLSWSFLPNWSDNIEIITADFNPLTELSNS